MKNHKWTIGADANIHCLEHDDTPGGQSKTLCGGVFDKETEEAPRSLASTSKVCDACNEAHVAKFTGTPRAEEEETKTEDLEKYTRSTRSGKQSTKSDRS